MAGQEQITRGIALRIAAAGCFSIMSALLKLASTQGVVAPEMLFYRALFGLPVVLGWVLIGPGVAALRTQRPWAHIGRSALGISAILCTFHALVLLSLPDATTIAFTAPVFATILSWLFLRERVGRHRWLAVLFGFVGVAVVMRPGASDHVVPLAGVLIGLASAVGTAGVTVTIRQLRDTEHVAAIVFWFFTASLAVGALLLPFFGSWHHGGTLLLLAGAGIAGGLAQLSMTASLQAAPVSVIAPFDYLQMVGALILGWFLLGTAPGLNTLAGGVLIAGSGLYTAWREHRLRRARPIPPTQPLA